MRSCSQRTGESFRPAAWLALGLLLAVPGKAACATAQRPAPLDCPREVLDAVQLKDGRLLVIGEPFGKAGGRACAESNVVVFDPTSGAWSSARRLPLANPTSLRLVTLEGGHVLAVHGQKTLLYDPGADRWAPGANLPELWQDYTLSPLPDGRALLAGGVRCPSPCPPERLVPSEAPAEVLAQEEQQEEQREEATEREEVVSEVKCSCHVSAASYLLDAQGQCWSPGPRLQVPRFSHQAAVLPGGTVFLAGGFSDQIILTRAWSGPDPAEVHELPGLSVLASEVLDSIRGRSDLGPFLKHSDFQMTALRDGRVLLVPADRNVTWFYDPTGDRIQPGPSLRYPRTQPALTPMPDGRVVLSGGQCLADRKDTLIQDPCDRVEVFSPGDDLIVGGQALPIWRTGHLALAIDHHLLVVGGRTVSSGDIFAARDDADCGCDCRGPAGSPVPAADPAGERPDCDCVDTCQRIAERARTYESTRVEWAAVNGPDCPAGTHDGGDGHCLPPGECTSGFEPLADGRCAGWLVAIDSPWEGCCGFLSPGRALVLSTGQVLLTGGTRAQTLDQRAHAQAVLFELDSGETRRLPAMQRERTRHAAVQLGDGRILVMGGQEGEPPPVFPGPRSAPSNPTRLAECELFDSGRAIWQATGSLNIPRSHHAAVVLADGQVLAIGGSTHAPANQILASVERFSPRDGSWSLRAPLPVALDRVELQRQASGDVLVRGTDGEGKIRFALYAVARDRWREDPGRDWQITPAERLSRTQEFPLVLPLSGQDRLFGLGRNSAGYIFVMGR